MLKNFFKKENILDFSCQSCGNCCRFFSVNITHLDIKRILDNRPDLKTNDFIDFKPSTDKNDNEAFISTSGKKELVLKKKSKNSQECIFLENNKCSIHAFKPLVCRVWPFSLEKGEINWIKDHLSFIKKECKHIMKENSNNPDELKKLIKQHYKERKIFSKLVENWNNEKEKYKSEFFYDILDNDFINFILQEIEINKAIDEANKENSFLEKFLTFLIPNRRVELILESKFLRIFEKIKKVDFNFIVYTKEENINYFLSNEFIKNLREYFNKENIFIDNKEIFFENDSSQKIFINFREIHKLNNEEFPYDTFTLYNPYNLDIKILDKEYFKNKLLENIYQNLLVNLELFLLYFNNKELINSYFILNKILIDNLYSLVSINNYKYFDLNDISYLNNNNKELENFFYEIKNLEIKENSLIIFCIKLINLLKNIFYISKDIEKLDLLRNKIEVLLNDYD